MIEFVEEETIDDTFSTDPIDIRDEMTQRFYSWSNKSWYKYGDEKKATMKDNDEYEASHRNPSEGLLEEIRKVREKCEQYGIKNQTITRRPTEIYPIDGTDEEMRPDSKIPLLSFARSDVDRRLPGFFCEEGNDAFSKKWTMTC